MVWGTSGWAAVYIHPDVKPNPAQVWPALALLWSGCHLFSSGAIDQTCEDRPGGCLEADVDTDTDSDTDTDTDAQKDLGITTISPGFGPRTGGYTTTISGKGFQDGTTVRFGSKLGQIATRTGSLMEVTVPALARGTFDIEVEREDGQAVTIEDGFRTFKDAQEAVQIYALIGAIRDPAFPGSITNAAFGSIFWVEDTDQPAWAGYSAGVNVFEDEEVDGICGENPDWADLLPAPIEQVTLRSETSEVDFIDLGTEHLYLRDVGLANWPSGEVLDMDEIEPHAGIKFSLPSIARLPEPLDLVSHDTTIISPEVPGDVAFVFEHTSDHPDSKLVISGALFGTEDGVVIGRIHCVARDDGFFRLDADAWDLYEPWEEGNRLEFHVGRIRTTDTVLPHTNGLMRVGGFEFVAVYGTSGVFESHPD